MIKLSNPSIGAAFLFFGFCLTACNKGLQSREELRWNEHRVPNFSNSADWIALPNRQDLADEVPKGLPEDALVYDENELPIDVFFVYPTQYFEGKWWNASVDDESINEITDTYPMRLQALSLIHISEPTRPY